MGMVADKQMEEPNDVLGSPPSPGWWVKGHSPQRQIAMRLPGQGASTQAALPHAEGKRLDLSATRALGRAGAVQGLYVARDDKCEPLALRDQVGRPVGSHSSDK